jgi:hypothetical protein
MLVMWKLRVPQETRGSSQLLFYRKVRREMSTELSFEGDDYYRLFDLLIDAAGKEWSESPTIILDGRRRSLHSAAAMISKELGYQSDLLGRHQEKVDSQFSKEQRGYGRTAQNLVNRAHENASASMHRLAGSYAVAAH